VKIIKNNYTTDFYPHKVTCRRCASEYEVESAEDISKESVPTGSDPRGLDAGTAIKFYTNCPCCSSKNAMPDIPLDIADGFRGRW
jgi:hypothetical protein